MDEQLKYVLLTTYVKPHEAYASFYRPTARYKPAAETLCEQGYISRIRDGFQLTAKGREKVRDLLQ